MNNLLKPIEQQVVVIFGATSGIGLQTAMQMAYRGARVALIGRDQASVDQAVNKVRQEARAARVSYRTSADIAAGLHDPTDHQVIGLVADAARWEDVKSAADQTAERFGRVDTWVHAASVSEWALFEETTPDEFQRIIDVNLTGMAFGAMAALPHLKRENGGAIIFISSVAGRIPLPYQSAYSAAKHGVSALGSVLRMEMKHEGTPVSVTTVIPTSVNTPLFEKSRTRLGVEPRPIPPVYSPELVAQAILYASQHPVREISVGGAGWLMGLVRRISPGMTQRYLNKKAFEQQRSDEMKSVSDEDNLFTHTQGYNRVTSEFDPETVGFSAELWLATHPMVRWALKAAAVGGLAFITWRIIAGRRKPSAWERAQKGAQKQLTRASKELARAGKRVAHASQNLPFVHQKSTLENFIDLLAGLPLIGLLPFLNKPSLRDRIQESVQKSVEKLPLDKTQKVIQRAQDRLPSIDTGKMAEKLQERVPRRHKESQLEPAVDKITTKGRKAVEKQLRRAEKLSSR